MCVLGPDYKQAASPVERAENLKPVLHVIASQIFTELVLMAGNSVEKLLRAQDIVYSASAYTDEGRTTEMFVSIDLIKGFKELASSSF